MKVLLALVLAGAALGGDDWFVLRVRSVDASTDFAHDGVSGVLVRYGGYPRASDRLLELRRSARLLERRTGRAGRWRWELLELSNPSADAEALRRDMGDEPQAGSWQAALLAAYSPPPSCAREVLYYVREPGKPYTVFRSAPCDASQRARVAELVESVMAGRVLAVAAIREAQQAGGVVGLPDRTWLGAHPSASQVLARLGPPRDVWPLYPSGITFLYVDASDGGVNVAVDFSADRVAAGVRVLPQSSAP